MNHLLKILFILIASQACLNVAAQKDLEKTEILILGSHHLSQIKDFQPEMVNSVIKKLSDMKFDAVCIENMSTELLMDIRSRNDSAFSEVLEYFGGNRLETAETAQKQLGVNYLKAQDKLAKLVRNRPGTDQERLQRIELSLATGDLASATLHYSYLIDKSLMATSKVASTKVEVLKKNLVSANEIYSIVIPVAAKQQHQQIHYIDNFQDEALLFKHFAQFIEDYTRNQDKFKDIGSLPVFTKTNEWIEKGKESKNLLGLYQFLNSEEFMSADYEAQWKVWLTTQFESGSDRSRYALWEMRNLQITANILQTAAHYPGKRILVVIGASHKSFIEKHLKQIPDVQLLGFAN